MSAEYAVVLDAASLGQATTISVNVPGYYHVVERSAFEVRPRGAYRWHGKIADQYDLLITSDGVMAHMKIDGPDEQWRVWPQAGQHLLTRIDLDFPLLPDEVEDGDHLLPLTHTSLPALPKAENQAGVQGVSDIIDLMILYTAEARNGGGGEAQIRNFAQHLIDRANQVFANSQVNNIRYRLRHVSLSNAEDGASSSSALSNLFSNQSMQLMRDWYGADTAVLLVEQFSDSVAGRAYVQRNPRPQWAPLAVAVALRSSSAIHQTFEHEAGHILGMEHDLFFAGIPPAQASFPWSFGHFRPAENHPSGFFSVMAYGFKCGGGCPGSRTFPRLMWHRLVRLSSAAR